LVSFEDIKIKIVDTVIFFGFGVAVFFGCGVSPLLLLIFSEDGILVDWLVIYLFV
jgi:hypothetical protein